MKRKLFFFFILLAIAITLPATASSQCYLLQWSYADLPSSLVDNCDWNTVNHSDMTEITYCQVIDSWAARVAISSYPNESAAQTAWTAARAEAISEGGDPLWEVLIDDEDRVAITMPSTDKTTYVNTKIWAFYKGCIVEVEKHSCELSNGHWSTQGDCNSPDLYNLLTGFIGSAKALIDSKCGGTKPEITLEPSEFPLFHANIVSGDGFAIKIHDADGLKDASGAWKLDWSTFRIYLNNSDISMHFVNTALNAKIVTWSESANDLKFIVKPDPAEFMNKHDVFGIPWNGDHKISLAVCDTTGLCDQTDYTIYFGPIAVIGSPSLKYDSAAHMNYVDFAGCIFANIGVDVPEALFYFVAARKSGNTVEYISQVEKFSGGYEYETGLHPATSYKFLSGKYYAADKLFDVSTMMNENLTFYLGIVDPDTGVFNIDSVDFYTGYAK